MKNKIVIIITLMILIGVFSLQPKSVAQTDQLYGYAYRIGSQDNYSIQVIHPNTGDIVYDFGSELIPSQQVPSEIVASPTGEWIAIEYLNRLENTGSVRLYNMLTAETRDIDLYYGFADYRFLRWSSDGNYLAFLNYDTLREDRRQAWQVHIYSVATDTTQLIRAYTSGFTIRDYLLSDDNTQIAVWYEGCTLYPDDCERSFAVYDITTGNHISTLSITPLEGQICQPDWSPDGRYISYVFSCDLEFGDFTREVYVGDVVTNTTTPLTNFTRPFTLTQDASQVFQASYDTFWYNTNNIMVAYRVLAFSTLSPQFGTNFFDLSGIASSLTSQEIVDVTPNSNRQEYVYLALTLSNDVASPPNARSYITLLEANIEIGTFDGISLTSILSFNDAGCEFEWSPDGNFIKFEACSTDGNVSFINRISEQITTVRPLPFALIGWVALPPD